MPKTEEFGVIQIDTSARPDIPDDSRSLVTTAVALQVIDDESFEIAAGITQTCAARINTIQDPDNDLNKACKSAHGAHKAIVKVLKDLTEPYERVKMLCTTKMRAYRQEQDRQRQEAERAQRQQQESEQRRLEAEAAEAKRVGDLRTVREVVQKIEEVQQAPFIPDAKPQVEGLTERRPWTGVLDDQMVLIKAIADGTYPLMHAIPLRGGGEEMVPIVIVSQAVLTHYAKRLGENMRVPGCHAERGLDFSVRGN